MEITIQEQVYNVPTYEVEGITRYIIEVPKKERHKARDIRLADEVCPLKWDREKSTWYLTESKHLVLYQEWLVKVGEEVPAIKKAQNDKLGRILYYKMLAQNHIEAVFEDTHAFKQLLKSMSRFRKMSLSNIALINLVNPHAEFFTTLAKWNQKDLLIKEGAKALTIFGIATLESTEESCIKTIERSIKINGIARIGFYFIKYHPTLKDAKGKNTYNIYKEQEIPILEATGINVQGLKEFLNKKILGIALEAIPDTLINVYETQQVTPKMIGLDKEHQIPSKVAEEYLNFLQAATCQTYSKEAVYNASVTLLKQPLTFNSQEEGAIPLKLKEESIDTILDAIFERLIQQQDTSCSIEVVNGIKALLHFKFQLTPPEVRCPSLTSYKEKSAYLRAIKRNYDSLSVQIEAHLEESSTAYTTLLEAMAAVRGEQENRQPEVETLEKEVNEEITVDTVPLINPSSEVVVAPIEITNEALGEARRQFIAVIQKRYESLVAQTSALEIQIAQQIEEVEEQLDENTDIVEDIFADYKASEEEEIIDIYAEIEAFQSQPKQEAPGTTIEEAPAPIEDLSEPTLLQEYPQAEEVKGLYKAVETEEVVAINQTAEGLTIQKGGKTEAFTVVAYNALLEQGYQKIGAINNLIALMTVSEAWEEDSLTTREELRKADYPAELLEVFETNLVNEEGMYARMDLGESIIYGVPITSYEFLMAFLTGEFREYEGIGCAFNAKICSEGARAILEANAINIMEYDDTLDPLNRVIYTPEILEIKEEAGEKILYISEEPIRALTPQDEVKIAKINEYLKSIDHPVLKGSVNLPQVTYMVLEDAGDTTGQNCTDIEMAAGIYDVIASATKNIALIYQETTLLLLKKGRINVKQILQNKEIMEIPGVHESLQYLIEHYGIYEKTITSRTKIESNEPNTPMREAWVKFNQIVHAENVEVLIWQVKEAYREKYRGRGYYQLINIEHRQVRDIQYEIILSMGLRSCESINKLKDSLFYQLVTENEEDKPVLTEFYVPHCKPLRLYLGDVIEICSAERHECYYIDTLGFQLLEDFHQPPMLLGKGNTTIEKFKRQYQLNPKLAIMEIGKVDEKTAKLITSLDRTILPLPQTDEDLVKYLKKGKQIAFKLIKNMKEVPVLICNRCISLLPEDEATLKAENLALYEEIKALNTVLKRNNVVPFKKLNASISAYKQAVAFMKHKEASYYMGYDELYFSLYGEDQGQLYVYHSKMKLGVEELYEYVKMDLDQQYKRLLNEYQQKEKHYNEPITSSARLQVKQEMECYVKITKCINQILKKK